MLTRDELETKLADLEAENIERTRAFDKADKMGQAISAFANDLADRRQPGYLLLGVENDGRISGKRISDAHLASLGGLKSDGGLLPPPSMSVEVFHFDAGDVVAIEVFPSIYPPIRYQGQAWVRVGPRKAIATDEDIHILEEKRLRAGIRFEEMPCISCRFEDLDIDLFKNIYLPKAIQAEIIDDDPRSVQEQMEALRFMDRKYHCPTNLGVILFAKYPNRYIPSAYIQYVSFDGNNNSSDILAEHAYRGPLIKVLNDLNAFVKVGITRSRPVKVSALQEEMVCDYPEWAIRELLLNAIIHRDYQIGNAPIKFYEYKGRRIEITNPGGLFGQVNSTNFPFVNDYRNPQLAEAMKVMGFVNKFNLGIRKVKEQMQQNGNPMPVFDDSLRTLFRVIVSPRASVDGTLNEPPNVQKDVQNDQIEPQNVQNDSSVGTLNPSDGTLNPSDGTLNPSDGTLNPSDGTSNPSDGTSNPSDGTSTPSDGTLNMQSYIINMIKLFPGIKRKELHIKTGIPLRTLSRLLNDLINKDTSIIEYRGSKKTGGWFIKKRSPQEDPNTGNTR